MNTSDDTNDLEAIGARLIAGCPIELAPTDGDGGDPATRRRRWLGDRAQVLLDGGFPKRAVDDVRGGQLERDINVPSMVHAREFRAAPVGERHMLVMLGGVGTGKTTAAAWIAAEVGGSKPGLVRSSALERAGRYDRDLAAWLATRTLLVIDDLGAEYMDARGAYRSVLDELIDVAYGARRRLVITSNLDQQGVADRVGERIWSRFCAGAEIVHCGSHDLRSAP